jgi:hypothetical protein
VDRKLVFSKFVRGEFELRAGLIDRVPHLAVIGVRGLVAGGEEQIDSPFIDLFQVLVAQPSGDCTQRSPLRRLRRFSKAVPGKSSHSIYEKISFPSGSAMESLRPSRPAGFTIHAPMDTQPANDKYLVIIE